MKQSNLLIFMTDQQRGDTIPPYSRAYTPNLDKFCREGVTFSNAFCPSPHCCPSRATFFTGLYPSQHGVWNNVDVGNALSRGLYEDVRLWSEDLSKAGYDLHFSGKWHVSHLEGPLARGWKEAFPVGRFRPEETAMTRPHVREWEPYKQLAKRPEDVERAEAEVLYPGYAVPYKHYGIDEQPWKDREVVDAAIAKLSSSSPDVPWCQYVGVSGPHNPYFAPQRYLDMYPIEEIELPSSFTDTMSDKPGIYRRTRDFFDQLTEREQKEAIRHYLALCTYEDALFGEVLQALEETGQAENTLVLYTSDHGDYAAEHGLWCKGLPAFRGAYHIPAAIRWPQGIEQPGRVEDAFVSLADFGPTFLECAQLETGRSFIGQSLMPFLTNKTTVEWRDAIFTQTNGNEMYGVQRSVTTKGWKYVYNGFDYDELYDLSADPEETVNRAADPSCREVIRDMCGKLWKFAYETGDVSISKAVMCAFAPFGPAEAFRGDSKENS